MAKDKDEEKIDIFKNRLVPEAEVLDEDKVEEVLDKYNATKKELPKILTKDPMVKALDADPGDVLEITRDSETAGESKFYRFVVHEI